MNVPIRILGIDYGDRRTGLAISDPTGLLAGGIGTVYAEGDNRLIDQIRAVTEQYGVTAAVLGHPVNMNGTLGVRAQKAEAFAEKLRTRLGLEVILWDERCTTMEAGVFLNATDTRGKKRKNSIDTLSAQIILQEYLDHLRKNGSAR